MKSLKLFSLKILTLLLAISLIIGLSSETTSAARTETIPAMEVQNLGNYIGHHLTVLYGVGTRPFISTEGSQINLNQVKESRSYRISSDRMTIPQTQVEKEGFRPAYNLVVFVISPQPNYGWVNADGSTPRGVSNTTNRLSSLINAIDRSDIEGYVSTKGENTPMVVNIHD